MCVGLTFALRNESDRDRETDEQVVCVPLNGMQ